MRLKRYLLPTAFMAVLALAIVVAPEALAQNFGLDTAAGSSIPKTKDIATIIGKILSAALGFVGTLFLLLMVYAGFLWMTARGDSKKVDQAKQLITGAVIGVLIVASAYTITSFVLTAVTGSGASSDSSASIAPESVPIGGSCTKSEDCTPASSTICESGKCVSTIQ